jgi:hypothetical protein
MEEKKTQEQNQKQYAKQHNKKKRTRNIIIDFIDY